MRKIVLGVRIVFVSCICCAGNEVCLFSLTNEWGKGSTLDFRKKVYQTVPVVLKNGGSEEMIRWYQDVASYPDLMDATGLTSWMHEKVETLLRYSLRSPVRTSTNCWFATAELLNRYRKMVQDAESNANVKVDFSLAKTNPKKYNELLYGKKPLEIKAWNLKCVTTSLSRVVTNVFPKSVLPLLPESERDKMMSEVLERSGLKSSNEDKGGSLILRHCCLTVVSVIACSFAFGGCILYRRFKRRKMV